MKMREVNIKSSFPVVEDAKKLLLGEITRARFERIAVLKIVHGYGSTGKGAKSKNPSHRF